MGSRFTGRVVVVTGAGGGLGSALARGFAGEGAELVLTDVDEAGLDHIAAELRGGDTLCSTYRLDLAVESDIAAFAAQICERHPAVHVLVNNAGLAYGEINLGIEAHTQQRWLHFFAVNSIAPLLLGLALQPALARGKGVVLNQSSMASYMPANAYGITKATLNSITFAMAHKLGADGIRVNAIAPGIMETPASKGELSAETYARVQGMQLLKLHGTAEDIVALALFLASDEARFINNEIVHCDAGNQLRGWRV